MNDYVFGNYICSRRQAIGLSQFQLGALVGVSDKAVSKWENGFSKPRLSTCIKLAKELDVSVEELLSCTDKNNTLQGGQMKVKVKTNFEQKVREALTEKYGPTPPIECVDRLDSELYALTSEDMILSLDFRSKLNEVARAHNTLTHSRGTSCSWFSLWLLGGTRVNPLPPHYHCPICHKTEFRYDTPDGFDLPDKICCGRHMLRDGHKIPFEVDLMMVNRLGLGLDITISESFIYDAETTLRKFYTGKRKVIPVKFTKDGNLAPSFLFFAVLPLNAPDPELDNNGYWRIKHDDFYKYNYPHISLIPMQDLSLLSDYTDKRFIDLSFSDYVVPDILAQHAQDILNSMPEFSLYVRSDTINFSQLLKLYGLKHGTNVFHNNGKLLIDRGEVSFSELMSLREDVWNMVASHMGSKFTSGNGFALKVMDETRGGLYIGRYKGMPVDNEHLLREIEVPEWAISQMKNTMYMFPKAHCIEILLDKLLLIWYKEHGNDKTC